MFVPNYEDYDRTAINYGAAVYPQLWPEEMAGEGAVFRRFQQLTWMYHPLKTQDVIEYFKRILTKDEKNKYSEMVERTLGWLAERCGWTVKNASEVEELGVHPIYVTDQPIKDWWRKTWKMSDIHVYVDEPKQIEKDESLPKPDIKDRKGLVEYVLAQLAQDNGWMEVQPRNMYINKTFYKI